MALLNDMPIGMKVRGSSAIAGKRFFSWPVLMRIGDERRGVPGMGPACRMGWQH